MVHRQQACGQTHDAEQVHSITDMFQENIGEGIPIMALHVIGSAIGFFRAPSDWGFQCLRVSGEVDAGGQAKKKACVAEQ